MTLAALALLTLGSSAALAQYTATYTPGNTPDKTENGQSGTNRCGSGSSQDSMCQNAYLNSVTDFCLWAPPSTTTEYGDSSIGNAERIVVAWCTQGGRGTRVIPDGTIKGAHFVQTPNYIQITGVGQLTNLNIPAGDDGGELDPHGADGLGNPIGGLVFSSAFGGDLQQIHEWTSFISSGEFCFRACVGDGATQWCQHIYDVLGCGFTIPGDFSSGRFDDCKGDSAEKPGIYGTSTFYQGQNPTPAPHPAGATSQCQAVPTITNTGAAGPTPAPSSPATSGGNSQAIHPNGDSSKCLGVKGTIADNAPVHIYSCSDTDNGFKKAWDISRGAGAVKLSGTNFCLDAGSNPANGVPSKIYSCLSVSQQNWYYTGDNHIAITGGSQCLDSGNNGQTWSCVGGNTNQVWTSEATTNPSGGGGSSGGSSGSGIQIHPNNDNSKCLGVKGTIANNAPVHIYSCSDTDNGFKKAWDISRGAGAVKLSGTNFCLDAGSNPANGVPSKIYSCLSVSQQNWYYTDDNHVAITGGTQCLDSGNNGQTWSCVGGNTNQIWTTTGSSARKRRSVGPQRL